MLSRKTKISYSVLIIKKVQRVSEIFISLIESHLKLRHYINIYLFYEFYDSRTFFSINYFLTFNAELIQHKTHIPDIFYAEMEVKWGGGGRLPARSQMHNLFNFK